MNNVIKLSLRPGIRSLKQLIVYAPCFQPMIQVTQILPANPTRYLSVCSINLASDNIGNKKKPVKRETRNYGYSIEDDNMIAKHIKLHGFNYESCKNVAKELHKDWKSVRIRYKFHIENQPTVKGKFLPKEDDIIVDYLARNGTSLNVIEDLTLLLGRSSPYSVRTRHSYLLTSNVRAQKLWTFEEDIKMLRHLLNEVDAPDLLDLENAKTSHFDDLATNLQRTSGSCYEHWHQTVLPILKTHIKGLSLEWNWIWQRYLMAHITKKKYKHSNDININQLLSKKPYIGQTYNSMAHFVRSFNNTTHNDERTNNANNELWKNVGMAYQNRSLSLLYFNDKKQKQKLDRAQGIIQYYKSLNR